MENDNDKRIKEKLDFFYKEKVPVHVKKKDRKFWNGLIIEKKSDNVYILKENMLGLVHLFVSDIWEVDEISEVWK